MPLRVSASENNREPVIMWGEAWRPTSNPMPRRRPSNGQPGRVTLAFAACGIDVDVSNDVLCDVLLEITVAAESA
jgi:hypothetical protein